MGDTTGFAMMQLNSFENRDHLVEDDIGVKKAVGVYEAELVDSWIKKAIAGNLKNRS
jgi:hypothetical protein